MDNKVGLGPSLGHYEVPAITAPDQQVRERRRVKELLRYLQPFQAPIRSEGKPRIATDASLTAFAQLASMRLDCQRAFISLIDNTKQYIVAEATQTISLVSEDVYEKENDELSFGQTVLDFKTGVCPGTIACFTSPDSSLDVASAYIKASRSYYVINDMSMLEGYKLRSYVDGWPHMRYYAEVPINSPSGTCIGSLCVVDNKPRDGLDLRGLRILRDVANTVMDHLELCVSRIQQDRTERMIQGFGDFVEGKMNIRDSSTEAQPSGIRQLDRGEGGGGGKDALWAELEELQITRSDNLWDDTQPNQNLRSLESMSRRARSKKGGHNARSPKSHNESSFSSTSAHTTSVATSTTEDITYRSVAPTEDQTSNVGNNSSAPPTATEKKISGTEAKNKIDLSNPSSNGLEDILLRAANVIREAIGLDGVAFFDPRCNDGRLLTGFTPGSEDVAQPEMAQDIRQDSNISGASLGNHQIFSKVTSCSTKEEQDHRIRMPEKTLQILLKQFPQGGLLTFDGEGIVGAESLTSLIGESLPKERHDATSPAATHSHSFVVNNIELPDADIRRTFPGVTSLMLYPFRDNIRNKCLAHCIAWTSEFARVFQRQEFTYIASFSNSVIAEISRLEAIAADKAKSTFITSISHELRSPLHGIMASMEILRELTSETSFQDLFGTIESCGSTLLDTIDNVLAFSQTSRQTTKEEGDQLASKGSQSADGPESAVDLEILVEETTSICLNGVQFRMIVDSSAHHKQEQLRHGVQTSSKWEDVIVICDISPGEWLFLTNRSVWKRILLNIVGNALKYTSIGSIVVTLRQEMVLESSPDNTHLDPEPQRPPSTKPTAGSISSMPADPLETSPNASRSTSKRVVKLSVKDTGKGMSQDYLANFLFKPFYQENPLAPGTGLGLSIVQRLVRSIGGKITVVSEEGVGTEITVEVRLDPAEDGAENSTAELPPFSTVRMGISGLNPVDGLVETSVGTLQSKSETLLSLVSTITSYAAASNIATTPVDSVDSEAADILFMQDLQYRRLESSQILAMMKPVIVLCMEPLRSHEHAFEKPMNVVLLSNPFGPRKFQRTIRACLRIRRSLLETSLVEALPSAASHPLMQRTTSILQIQKPNSPRSSLEKPSVSKVERVGPSLLLVEDNPINLKILVTSINRMGHPFMTATNGVEAVEAYKAASSKILLVFMDIQMPKMDGIEASREIRKYELRNALPRTLIVALTALDSAEAKQAAVDSGVDMFFTKPVSVKKLKEIVSQHYKIVPPTSPSAALAPTWR